MLLVTKRLALFLSLALAAVVAQAQFQAEIKERGKAQPVGRQ